MCCEKCVIEVWREKRGQCIDTGFCVEVFPPHLLKYTPLSRTLTHTFPFIDTPHTEVHSSNKQQVRQRAQSGVNSSVQGWFSFPQSTALFHCLLMGRALNRECRETKWRIKWVKIWETGGDWRIVLRLRYWEGFAVKSSRIFLDLLLITYKLHHQYVSISNKKNNLWFLPHCRNVMITKYLV